MVLDILVGYDISMMFEEDSHACTFIHCVLVAYYLLLCNIILAAYTCCVPHVMATRRVMMPDA